MMNSSNIVLLGDTGVGKSSIVDAYMGLRFNNDRASTAGGARVYVEPYELGETDVLFTIVDTPPFFLEDSTIQIDYADIIVLVYSVVSRESFESCKKILNVIKHKRTMRPPVIVLVGNKKDLLLSPDRDPVRDPVELDEVLALGYPATELTAKSEGEVKELFKLVSERFMERRSSWWFYFEEVIRYYKQKIFAILFKPPGRLMLTGTDPDLQE